MCFLIISKFSNVRLFDDSGEQMPKFKSDNQPKKRQRTEVENATAGEREMDFIYFGESDSSGEESDSVDLWCP